MLEPLPDERIRDLRNRYTAVMAQREELWRIIENSDELMSLVEDVAGGKLPASSLHERIVKAVCQVVTCEHLLRKADSYRNQVQAESGIDLGSNPKV